MKSTVKVMVSLLLVVGALVCLVACGGGKKGPSGVYKLEKVKMLGEEISAEKMEIRMTLEFLGNGKGTAVSFADGNEDKIEFKYDGKTITMVEDDDETVVNYKLNGKVLTVNVEEDEQTFMEMTFKKK